MTPSISKECFPKPNECVSCTRKLRQGLTKAPEASMDLKRCSGCHMMTYCDKECQAEHWAKLHKKHCKFLSGKKEVEGAEHVGNSCSLCAQERESSQRDLVSCNSPKTNCHLERVKKCMRTMIGGIFKFHGEGKTCSCSAEFGCELPFPLGELTGDYVGFGLDEMLAHALKIVNAMKMKGERGGNYGLQEKLEKFFIYVASMRSINWAKFLVNGSELSSNKIIKTLQSLMTDLENSYGIRNAWLDSLSFTVVVISHVTNTECMMSYDSRSLEDRRFPNLKLLKEYSESQLKHYQEKNSVTKLKLWPTLAGGLLEILAPEELHCGNCRALLTGPICVNTIDPEENDPRPILMPHLGELGLVASCPDVGGQDCRISCIMQNTRFRLLMEDLVETIDEETELFFNEVRYCDMCLTASLSSHRCSHCYAAQYCSTQCQHHDLAFHSTVCDAWAKDKRRKLTGKKKQVEINANRLKEQFKDAQQWVI